MSTSTSPLTSTPPSTAVPVNGSSQTSHSLIENNDDEKNSVVIKVGMVGDSQIGKTSLMVKYVEGSFDEDYIQTLGVNFMEKTISVRRTTITFSIWDLGGQREFVNMLPLVCNDAVAILFMFDLSRKSTLNSVKEWYRQARGFNKTAIPFLIGTKFDQFATFPRDEQEEITKQAKRFARAMHASLIFCSTSASINVQKIFKIVLAKAFDLKCVIPEIEGREKAVMPREMDRCDSQQFETGVGRMGEKEANEQPSHLYHKTLIIATRTNHLLFHIGYLSRALPFFRSTLFPTGIHSLALIPIISSFPFVVLCYRILPLCYIIHAYMTCLLPATFRVRICRARTKNWHYFLKTTSF